MPMQTTFASYAKKSRPNAERLCGKLLIPLLSNLTLMLSSAILLNVVDDGPDNYFAKAMKPAYKDCNGDGGKKHKIE